MTSFTINSTYSNLFLLPRSDTIKYKILDGYIAIMVSALVEPKKVGLVSIL